MGALKPSSADSLTVAKVPSLPQDVVRLTDLDAALSDLPTVGQMNSAIAYVAQPPTTITPDNSLIVSALSPNTFQIQVRLSPDGVTQAAQIDLHGVQSVVSAWTEIVLGYQQVSNLVITRNLIAGDAVTFTGVQGVDYYLDSFNGIITITPNSGLINSAESPQTTQIEIVFDCAEVDSGGGLEVVGGSSGGLEVVWGLGHNEVPRGDTVQELLDSAHLPLSPDPAALTTVTTIDELQRIRVEVNVEANGGIEISSDGELAVDLPGIIAAVEAATPDASSSTAGYMTPEQVVILGALSNQVPVTWGTTDSVALQVDDSGNVTADVIAGIGITIGSVAESGNSIQGLFGDEDIWYGLSLNSENWPAGWPNVVYWGIGVVGDVITFSVYTDSGASNLLASGTASVSALESARTPQNLNLYDLSATLVASLLINTATAFPVYSTQSIVLTATGVSADLTILALKSTTDLQQVQIDQLETESSSTSSAIALLEADVAALGGTVLTPTNLNDFNCLATLLEKWEFAHRMVAELRLELPNIGTPSGDVSPAPFAVPLRQIVTGGSASNIYTVDFQIRGVAKVKDVWPATATQGGSVIAGTGGRAVKNGTPYVITLDSIDSDEEQTQDPFIQSIENALNEMIAISYTDTWALVISDNGTGFPDTYYLNAAISDAESLGGPHVISYTLPSIPIKGGATASLVMLSDGQAIIHELVVPDAAPYPESFPGYFMQVDALDVQDVCPIGDIAADGNVDGIGVFGATTRKDLDAIYGGSTGAYIGSTNNYPALNASPEAPGFNGAVAVGTDGTDIPTGNGLASTANQPLIALPRDLLRLGVIDGGNADDWVYDILINGKDIWVAGAFSRWGNAPCPGLVRLDHLGRFAYDFNNARAAFSEPVRRLALASDGSILAASIFASMYQNNRSCQVHKILRDGSEDVAFTPSDQMSINDLEHPNLVIDVAGLSDGKVAVLTPRGLTALNADGSVFSQQDSGGTDMFLSLLAVPGTNSLLLSSHAWSSLNQPCLFGGANIPRGLKLLAEGGSNFQIDSAWANPAYIGLPALGAGTGAMSSCMRAIAAADNSYFIIGNGLERFSGVDTSWNTQILGNLLRYSEAVNNTSAWSQYGATSIIPWFPGAPAGVSGATHAWVLLNTGGLGFQSFVQQSATVAAGATCIFEFYLLKRTPVGYPVVQMQFAGSSSGASTGGGGGTPIEAYAWLDPSGVHATPLVVNVSGGGNPQVTMIDAPTDPTNWWYVTFALTNASADTDCNITIFPAYSATWGGTSTSVNDGNAISAPSLIYNFWSPEYVPTTSSPALPTESASNSDQFQGLYKILFDGAADQNFQCTMTYSEDDGMAIPFAIDGHGNIYCGGPISSIKDSVGAVHETTPWMLYKLNSNGQFLAQYNLFDDAVLIARITPYGNLVVGGKFQFYGSYACGRFVMIDPWGNLIRDPIVLDDPVFTASTSSFPDVLTLPGLKGKLLLDRFTDPPSEYVWSNLQGTWVQAGSGGFTQLPPVDIEDSPAVPPNLWVPGESGFNGSSPLSIILSDGIAGCTIWYTEDGSDPRITSNAARHQYPANASAGSYPEITTPTIITAYASKPGYADSVLSVATFGQTLAMPVISPASQNVTSFPVLVTITGPVGAAIWYTTDGTNPVTSGTASLYSGAFNAGNALSVGATVLAAAKQTGYFTSAITQANYGENIMPDLAFTPAGGAAVPVTVVISLPTSFTAQYNVVYTTSTTGNPPNPLTNPSQAITAPGPLTLNLTVGTAIQAYATAPGYTPSPVATAAYSLSIVNAPTITLPPAGSGIGTIFIAADTTGPGGQSIVYTINGGQPVTANNPAAVDLSDVAGVNGVITITAYSTFPGWANSPTATAQEAPILLSGLIDVNFTPGTDAKVGRMAIFADPFKDVWNQIGASPGLIAILQENFYAGGNGTAQAPGATVPAQLNFTPTTGEFGVIPFVGDLAYRNFLKIGAVSSITNIFGSATYGLGIYAAISTGGGIWTSPDGNIWTEIQSGFPALTRVVFASVPAIPATVYFTTFEYSYITSVPFLSADIPQLAFFQAALPGFTFVSATANGVVSNGLEPVVVVYSGPTAYPILPAPPDPNYGVGLSGGHEITVPITVTSNGVPAYAAFYVTGSGVVLASTDGINWTNFTGNLPLDFVANDLAITNVGGVAQVEIVGSGGRQFYSVVGAASPAWTETTPTSNTGATLNSKVTCPFKAAQTQVAVGDAGTIYNFTGLVPNAYDQVSFTRVAANTSTHIFCFVSRSLNGITEAYTQTIGSSPVISPTGMLPAGTTNLFDVCAYQFGFIAVGDKKILLGAMSAGTLHWQDITPTGAEGTSSTGGSAWGSSGGDEGPMPFNYKGVTVGANGRVIVVGDEGIIYGNFNGSIWIWEWSNQIAGPPTGSQEVLRGTFSNLTPGFYDLLLYGHGDAPVENTAFHAYVDGVQVRDVNDVLEPATAANATFQNTNWELDRQYVEFGNLETIQGSIAFGVVPTGVTSTTYLIETVNWTEYGDGTGSGGGGTPSPTSGGSGSTTFDSLSFFGNWPVGWPSIVYYQIRFLSNTVDFTISSNSEFPYNLLAYAIRNDAPFSESSTPIFNESNVQIGTLNLTSDTSDIGFTGSIALGGSAFGNLLGALAGEVSYSTSTTNPNVQPGSQIVSAATVGNITPMSGLNIPAGTSKEGGSATCYQLATRQYLAEVLNSDTSGYINAVQLRRRQGAGVRMGTPIILPETLDNLPFPSHPNGLDLVGIFVSPSDVALGIGPISNIYYSITACPYSVYEMYLASGASGAGISPDPTASTGTLYTAPFALADNSIGFLVRAISTCVGRTTSNVAAAWYWPMWPESSSQGQ